MSTKITKWGNSLAVRLPRIIAEESGFKEGTVVDIRSEPTGIILKQSVGRKVSLRELVQKISPQNRHEEVSWGHARGKEVW